MGSETGAPKLVFLGIDGPRWRTRQLCFVRLAFPFPPLSSGVFEIAEASGVRTGTKIIIHLKSDSTEFASEARVRGEWESGPL